MYHLMYYYYLYETSRGIFILHLSCLFKTGRQPTSCKMYPSATYPLVPWYPGILVQQYSSIPHSVAVVGDVRSRYGCTDTEGGEICARRMHADMSKCRDMRTADTYSSSSGTCVSCCYAKHKSQHQQYDTYHTAVQHVNSSSRMWTHSSLTGPRTRPSFGYLGAGGVRLSFGTNKPVVGVQMV